MTQKVIQRLEGRDKINVHAISNKLNEIIDLINEPEKAEVENENN